MGKIRVAVAFAPSAEEQRIVSLYVPSGATVESVIRASGLLDLLPQMDLANLPVGIYGERVALTHCVEEGDRVEIYRPLVADPKEARRRRARAGRPRSSS